MAADLTHWSANRGREGVMQRVYARLDAPGLAAGSEGSEARAGLPGELPVTLGRERHEYPAEEAVYGEAQRLPGMREALHHIQAKLIASMPADGRCLIAVCSAVDGEGKTTVALSLVEVLAEQFSRQTLLVDANLSAPRVHTLLDMEPSLGLQDCLAAGSVIPRAIEWSGRTWVMAAGEAAAGHPADAGEVAGVFRTLRSLFRLTIVDLPSFDATRPAAFLPFWADAVIWVVRAEHCPADVIADSMDLVGREKILGVVLNGYRSRLPRWLDRLV